MRWPYPGAEPLARRFTFARMRRHEDGRPRDGRQRDTALLDDGDGTHGQVRAARPSQMDARTRELALRPMTTHSERAVRPSQQPKIEHPYVARVPRSSLADAGCTRCARAGADAR